MVYVKSRNKCLKIAKELHSNITSELELLDYLPDSIFGRRFVPCQSDDKYHIIQHAGNLWFVALEFTVENNL